ncbi:MAG: HU family DNA-binding protein, partial [Paludibacteraceae bacterium]|nr:HU family DNA-binding protein [Paludibacteraceae bacterium]
MNKSELVDAMASASGLTKTDSKKALDAFISVVSDTLKKGDSV